MKFDQRFVVGDQRAWEQAENRESRSYYAILNQGSENTKALRIEHVSRVVGLWIVGGFFVYVSLYLNC